MALSPADFYAYSRATGAPVPEDPEERAQMAPSVAEFRRNQLKAPEQGQQQGQNALATLAGIGAMALAGVGAYQFAKGRLPKGAPASATAPVQTVDIARQAETDLRRVTTEGTQPAPSTPPPLSRQEVYKQVAAKPVEDLPRVYRPKGGADVPTYTDPRTGEIFSSGRNPSATTKTAGFTPRQYVESTGSLEVDPTDRLVAEMGEFQATRKKQLQSRMGRAYGQQLEKTADDLLQQLQATAPDLTTIQESSVGAQQNQFINAIESGEDQVTGRMKNQLQRNEGVDLAEVEALENIEGDIQVAASQLPDGVPTDQTLTPQRLSSQDLADMAKEEMMAQRQALVERGLRPGTQRFENALAQTWTSKAGARPGTEEFRESISLPTPIRAAVDVVEELEEDALPMRTQRSVPNVGPYAEVTQTAAGTAIRGASPSYYEAAPKQELRQLSVNPSPLVRNVPEESGLDLPGGLRVRGGIEPQVEPGQLSKQEIKYSVLDRPAGEEVVGGSAGIGIYGEEPGYVPGAMSKTTGEYSAASSRQPSYVPKWLLKKEQTPFSGVSTEGLLRAQEKSGKSGQLAIQQELGRRQRALESIALSETLRRANIEGRSPQEFLRRQLRGGI